LVYIRKLTAFQIAIPVHPISGEVGDELNTYNKQSFKVSEFQGFKDPSQLAADLETLKP
jgi:hypothetical protein